MNAEQRTVTCVKQASGDCRRDARKWPLDVAAVLIGIALLLENVTIASNDYAPLLRIAAGLALAGMLFAVYGLLAGVSSWRRIATAAVIAVALWILADGVLRGAWS